MEFLAYQLYAPLSAWGDVAVGEFRGTYEYPGASALIGMLGAALGLRREDEAAHAALRDGYGFAVGVQSVGKLLRDYHTAQVPGRVALKGRPHATRRDELRIPKHELNTILSTRDFRQDASSLVVIQQLAAAPYSLSALADALRKPKFVLYLGRKSCPPGAPLDPQVVVAAHALEAVERYLDRQRARLETNKDRKGRLLIAVPAKISRLVWSDGVAAGIDPHLTTMRKDRVIRRSAWQFGDRTEYSALIGGED
jgi:CRISPR system Cascade subunit CasD